jgi:two-component system, sensor histidine kinase
MAELLDAIPKQVDEIDTRPLATPRPILVIDDVAANLIAMEVALAPLKREIVTASSGDRALARLLERDFSLVLLDVQMPDLDGFDTAALIRARERTRHLPIIFITAHHNDQASVHRAYRLGAVDFLFKPIEPEILLAKASVFLTLQDQAEQLAAERLQRDFDEARRRYENDALRKQMARELEAKEQLSRLNRALADADRRKDEFLAILAHELRNPLAPIRSAIDVLRETSEPHNKRTLDILDRQSHQLARLIDDLLDVARIKANKIELRREVCDLRKVIEMGIATSAPRITERAHHLVVALPETPVVVLADPLRLAQVITNLLNNAARYTEPGGSIRIACTCDGTTATLAVSDSGVGISTDLLESVFDMFVQERVRPDGGGGLGLGLALARQLVELHSGTIRACSEGRGAGSRFEVRLPLASAELTGEVPVRAISDDSSGLLTAST